MVGGEGYLPTLGGGGTSPPVRIGRQNSIACACYVAVGMPLAFTQEDFLVHTEIHRLRYRKQMGSIH